MAGFPFVETRRLFLVVAVHEMDFKGERAFPPEDEYKQSMGSKWGTHRGVRSAASLAVTQAREGNHGGEGREAAGGGLAVQRDLRRSNYKST